MNKTFSKTALLLAFAPVIGGVVWICCKVSAMITDAGLAETLIN